MNPRTPCLTLLLSFLAALCSCSTPEQRSALCDDSKVGESKDDPRKRVFDCALPEPLHLGWNETELWVEFKDCHLTTPPYNYSLPAAISNQTRGIQKLIISEDKSGSGVTVIIAALLDGVRSSLIHLKLRGLSSMIYIDKSIIWHLPNLECVYIEEVEGLSTIERKTALKILSNLRSNLEGSNYIARANFSK